MISTSPPPFVDTSTKIAAWEMSVDPDAWHYVAKPALALADQAGVEVRALCGFWFDPVARLGGGSGPAKSRICPRCVEVWLSLPKGGE